MTAKGAVHDVASAAILPQVAISEDPDEPAAGIETATLRPGRGS
jgi:hypothetical protein